MVCNKLPTCKYQQSGAKSSSWASVNFEKMESNALLCPHICPILTLCNTFPLASNVSTGMYNTCVITDGLVSHLFYSRTFEVCKRACLSGVRELTWMDIGKRWCVRLKSMKPCFSGSRTGRTLTRGDMTCSSIIINNQYRSPNWKSKMPGSQSAKRSTLHRYRPRCSN